MRLLAEIKAIPIEIHIRFLGNKKALNAEKRQNSGLLCVKMVSERGIEPPTRGLGNRCSIH